MTDVIVHLRPVRLEGCEAKALEFFSRDVSSMDYPVSYDDRAMSNQPDEYDEQTDVAVIRRGMRLERLGLPETEVWQWLVNEAPTDLLTALPVDLDLKDVTEAAYPEIRKAYQYALDGFIGVRGTHRGLAFATKSLHLKRPALLPICDSYTTAMLGIPYRDDGKKAKRITAALAALDLTWETVRECAGELQTIRAHLGDHDLSRTPVRILDALLWLEFGGKIREGNSPPAED